VILPALSEVEAVNKTHLGDALDFWKGRVISLLHRSLNDLHVVPMFTDEDITNVWPEEHLRMYARLLGVRMDRILQPTTPFSAATRKTYFSNLGLSDRADVFLDPDTGVQPAASKATTKHVCFVDLAQLFAGAPRRLVLVYQHRPRSSPHDWADRSSMRVTSDQRVSGCNAFAYFSVNVAMLFVSRDENRLQQILADLQNVCPRSRMTRLHLRAGA
jgi:hypothetical protein